jgi:hypothetical protein
MVSFNISFNVFSLIVQCCSTADLPFYICKIVSLMALFHASVVSGSLIKYLHLPSCDQEFIHFRIQVLVINTDCDPSLEG